MNQFEEDCKHFYGKPLTGKYKHYCPDFDYLPIDETCSEFEYCLCEWEENERTGLSW
jgi:hypothetical protein